MTRIEIVTRRGSIYFVSMRTQHDLKEELKTLSTRLARIHKGLMDHQMSEREKLTGQSLNPATKLQLLLQDAEFAWLRALSQLMVMVDDGIFQKEPLSEEQVVSLKLEIEKLLFQQTHEEFASHFNTLLPQLPNVQAEYEELKNRLLVRH
jgi:hypothetical protein